MIAVSACLLGHNCRYDGGHKRNERVFEHLGESDVVAICPESLGGLKIPRSPAYLSGGQGADVLEGRACVLNAVGEELTEAFITGAQRAAEIIEKHSCTSAIMKEKSPSCGVRLIYARSIKAGDVRQGRGEIFEGEGVLTALLRGKGLTVLSESDF